VLVGLMAACPARQVIAPEPRSPAPEVAPIEVPGPVTDGDGDGVEDGSDRCPGDAGEAPHGCPNLDRDTDGDGILDTVDRCPESPETRNGYEDGEGCPDQVPHHAEKIGLLPAVQFGSGEAGVSRWDLIEMAASLLRENPGVEVLISGHTDAREGGSKARRTKLSLRRAEAVRDSLVERGVARERMEVRGAGAEEPIADSATKSGRAANRRVVFTVVEE
jgi:OOP family OmpA-OmpF porin